MGSAEQHRGPCGEVQDGTRGEGTGKEADVSEKRQESSGRKRQSGSNRTPVVSKCIWSGGEKPDSSEVSKLEDGWGLLGLGG